MNQYIKHMIPLLSLCAAFAACSDELTDVTLPDAGKSPIELSVGGVIDVNQPATRTVTDPTNSMNPLTANTSIFMYMQSDFIDLGDPHTYAGTQDSKKCQTLGVIDGNDGSVKFVNDATYTRKRYWDDAHARCSNISIWALACPGKSYIDESTYIYEGTGKFTPSNWTTGSHSNLSFSLYVQEDQNIATYNDYDVVYSNNLANYESSTDSSIPDGKKTDRRLKFNTTEKKFGKGEMVFYHALSKITIKLNKSTGYTGTNDFHFLGGGSNVKNVCLSNFNDHGILNIKTGQFSSCSKDYSEGIIGMKALWDEPNTTDTQKPTYELEAYVFPYNSGDNSKFEKSKADVYPIYFYIDNNRYQVSSKLLFDALQSNASNNISADATEVKLESGKHYIFTFNVAKTEINSITAKVAEWEEVTATESTVNNARVNIVVEDDRGMETDGLAFYRLSDNVTSIPSDADKVENYNWMYGLANEEHYTTSGNKKTATYDGSKWTLSQSETDPAWYWPNSLSYYHFRTVQPDNTEVFPDGTDGDYFKINATDASESTYDPRWGAPYKDLKEENAEQNQERELFHYKWKEDGSSDIGFDVNLGNENPHQIYKAIGATSQTITLIPIHMMSPITINITTSTDDSAVDLGDGTESNKTTVEVLNLYTKALVRMGNGYVDSEFTDNSVENTPEASLPIPQYNFTAAAGQAPKVTYFYQMIPQDLSSVDLRITTPDHNMYIVNLGTVVASSVSSKDMANQYESVSGGYRIDCWYPDYKYTYNFKITKKGISDLRATIVDWETVTAGDDNVQIR